MTSAFPERTHWTRVTSPAIQLCNVFGSYCRAFAGQQACTSFQPACCCEEILDPRTAATAAGTKPGTLNAPPPPSVRPYLRILKWQSNLSKHHNYYYSIVRRRRHILMKQKYPTTLDLESRKQLKSLTSQVWVGYNGLVESGTSKQIETCKILWIHRTCALSSNRRMQKWWQFKLLAIWPSEFGPVSFLRSICLWLRR